MPTIAGCCSPCSGHRRPHRNRSRIQRLQCRETRHVIQVRAPVPKVVEFPLSRVARVGANGGSHVTARHHVLGELGNAQIIAPHQQPYLDALLALGLQQLADRHGIAAAPLEVHRRLKTPANDIDAVLGRHDRVKDRTERLFAVHKRPKRRVLRFVLRTLHKSPERNRGLICFVLSDRNGNRLGRHCYALGLGLIVFTFLLPGIFFQNANAERAQAWHTIPPFESSP